MRARLLPAKDAKGKQAAHKASKGREDEALTASHTATSSGLVLLRETRRKISFAVESFASPHDRGRLLAVAGACLLILAALGLVLRRLRRGCRKSCPDASWVSTEDARSPLNAFMECESGRATKESVDAKQLLSVLRLKAVELQVPNSTVPGVR